MAASTVPKAFCREFYFLLISACHRDEAGNYLEIEY
jgi:hypothetical protein